MPHAIKDEICPECGSIGSLCSHPEYDEDSCPDRREDCDVPCPHIITCPICKGKGLVSLAVVSKHAAKTASIKWGSGS